MRPLPTTILIGLLALNASFVPAAAEELETFHGVELVPADWADGDSFLVRLPDGEEHTIRLYGADCMEWHVTDSTDARRLRAQRRYFGISDYGHSPLTSIELAKAKGAEAARLVRELLAAPFTVHTSFADGGGDGRYKRIYAFITTADGLDLAEVLVEQGLARAFGVYRSTPDGQSRDDYRDALKDAELVAARKGRGIWAYTDWDAVADERSAQRREEAEHRLATGTAPPARAMDLNSAARDELMRIPGIGEHYANAIIEHRPYRSVDELLRVNGIGRKRLEAIREWVKVVP
jgi:endonuclease YncB( thermonuclease family)